MTERPNIRRMQVPEAARKPLMFDARKEFTQEDRHKLWGELRERRRRGPWDTSLRLGAHMKILGMKAMDLTSKNWEKIEHGTNSFRQKGMYRELFSALVAL